MAWLQRGPAGVPAHIPTNLHEVAGWAYLLTYIRGNAGIYPPYAPAQKLIIEQRAAEVRQHWDPVMRYRHVPDVLPDELAGAYRAATWFAANYPGL